MAWTTPRDWTTGEFVTEAMMDTHIKDNFNAIYFVPKMKASDESVPASTTLQNDDDFFFSVAASEKWAVDLHVQVSTPAAADFKWNWTVPAGTTRGHTWHYGNPGANPDWATTGDGAILASGTLVEAVHMHAFFLVSSTAGTVQFQWAQSTATGTTTLKAGSYMIAHRMP